MEADPFYNPSAAVFGWAGTETQKSTFLTNITFKTVKQQQQQQKKQSLSHIDLREKLHRKKWNSVIISSPSHWRKHRWRLVGHRIFLECHRKPAWQHSPKTAEADGDLFWNVRKCKCATILHLKHVAFSFIDYGDTLASQRGSFFFSF